MAKEKYWLYYKDKSYSSKPEAKRDAKKLRATGKYYAHVVQIYWGQRPAWAVVMKDKA